MLMKTSTEQASVHLRVNSTHFVMFVNSLHHNKYLDRNLTKADRVSTHPACAITLTNSQIV